MLSTEQKDALADELDALHQTISAWCMRMAWPGGTPTPPFQAWERQAEIYDMLRADGIKRPKHFRHAWRRDEAA